MRALTHALQEGRLHHAYLFTGTRGVGKTTLARILAKALNCEQGVSATPCGRCSACSEIDSGRFVDLLEVDAATNTRVDEMRQLLENAVYAPTRGRYKVYVIDEVHMLSNSAFNAMLKTLEEPPEHVKFILATTDPQKIPVTVLSRCLQFNLKQMPRASIIEHLHRVLDLEGVPYELHAIRQLANAAAGSMRDALSLLDQAIAHGAGKVLDDDVRAMLGTIDTEHVFGLVEAVAAGNAAAALAIAEAMETRSLSFDTALDEIAQLLVRMAVVQMAPAALAAEDPDRDRLVAIAAQLDPEYVQLAYQIVIHGRQDLSRGPDGLAGFTMTLLRLLAFSPVGPGSTSSGCGGRRPAFVGELNSAATASSRGRETFAGRPATAGADSRGAALPPAAGSEAPNREKSAGAASGRWDDQIAALGLSGMVRTLAQHCEWVGESDGEIALRLAPAHRHLLVGGNQDKLQRALADCRGVPVRVRIELVEPATETPAARGQRERQELQDEAVAAIEGDSVVREVIDTFDASIVESSIKPVV